MAVQYYTNQPNTSQAAQQAGNYGQAGIQAQYGVGWNQPGTQAYSGYQQASMPGVSNLSATNPLAVNTSSMLGYIPESYQAANPYLGDYSGMFGDTSMWSQGYTPSTQPIGGGTTPASSQPVTSSLPSKIYRTQVPISGDVSQWQTPSWASGALNSQIYQNAAGDPYFVAYASSPLNSGTPWSTISNLGYDPSTFYGMEQATLGRMGYNPTTIQDLINRAGQADFQLLQDSLNQQSQGLNSAISNYVEELTKAMTPEQQTTTTAAPVSSTGLDLPAGFRRLPMPAEYYGYAAVTRPDELI